MHCLFHLLAGQKELSEMSYRIKPEMDVTANVQPITTLVHSLTVQSQETNRVSYDWRAVMASNF